jgi:hypothetical protein
MLTGWTRLGAVGALALGGFLVADPFGASSGAQSAAPITIAFVGTDTDPDLSDNGNIVVFASTDLAGVSSVVVHDRLADTTTSIPGSSGGQHPTVSADGCTVGWSVAAADDNEQVEPVPQPIPGTSTTTSTTEAPADVPVQAELLPFQAAGTDAALLVIDRCDPEAVAIGLVPPNPVANFGPAAMSGDGAVVVVSTGSEVLRFDRTADGYAPTASLTPPVEESPVEEPPIQDPPLDELPLAVAESVDVSDDGATVVFAAGPDLDISSGLTVFRTDRVGEVDTVATVATSAHQPSISGDGSTLAYSVIADDPASSTITIRENESVPVALGAGTRPMISRDGIHVVYEMGDALLLRSWTGEGPDAFAQTDTLTLTGPVAPTASGPVIDRYGRTVASDSIAVPDVDTDIMLNAITSDAGFDSDSYQLGSGVVGTDLATTVTFTNDGPASLGVASVAVDGTFTVLAESCTPVIRPGSMCTVEVGFIVQFPEEALGTVSLVPLLAVAEPAPFTTEVVATGQAPPVETSTTTTTTLGSTTGGTTGGSTSGGTTGGSTTGGTSSTTGGSRPPSTTGGRPTTTTTTEAPGAVVFSPTSFDFAPTIIEAGRRTGLVEIVNTTPSAVAVVGVRFEPADSTAFEIVENGCGGQAVPAAGRCAITIAFAPTDTGEQSARLIASLDSGTEVSATIVGMGAPSPTLTVRPGVATTGQVVTLRGVGFPTGLTVELTWSGSISDVAVDETGGFAIPVLVMPNTRSGPAGASVAGQDGRFGDVTATMLVTARTGRLQPSVLDGIGPNISR